MFLIFYTGLFCSNHIFTLCVITALGQVMLYVDGMNGVIAHNETIQWLYSLTASKVPINKHKHWTNDILPVIAKYAGHVRQTSADVWQRAQTLPDILSSRVQYT